MTAGTSATRRSPVKLSRGTPTIMKLPPMLKTRTAVGNCSRSGQQNPFQEQVNSPQGQTLQIIHSWESVPLDRIRWFESGVPVAPCSHAFEFRWTKYTWKKKRDRSAAPPSSIHELREETSRLVAPLGLIRRCCRCRGRFADGQLILLATEKNSRQRLVTSLVGVGGIPAPGFGFLQRKNLRGDFGNRPPVARNANFNARSASSPFHLIRPGRELFATDSNGFADLQRALVGIPCDGAGCKQQRKCQQSRGEFRLSHKSLFSFVLASRKRIKTIIPAEESMI